MRSSLSLLSLSLAAAGSCLLPASAQDASSPVQSNPGYRIETIDLPQGFDRGIGGVAFNKDGDLVVVARRTGVIIGTPDEDPGKFEWRVFASSQMHNSLGVLVEEDGSLLVPQMAELTRLRDTDRDGKADVYEAVCTDWGVTGNYHETNSGPIPDGEGNWFLAMGSASHAGPTFDFIRGEFSPAGRRGRNFSAGPWNGWVVKVTPDGKVIPWASGFRQANGIGMSPDGDLFVTDNQGDFKPVTPIYHVEQGKFYGHPTTLVWDPEFVRQHPDPLAWAVDHLDEVDRMRTKAAVLLPQGLMCNSASEPIFDTTEGKFGPFAGQMIVGDIAGERILRVMLEKVQGEYQGAVTQLVHGADVGGGTNRLCFSPDGTTLYAGQTYRGWGKPAEGLKRITFTGDTPFAVQKMSLTTDGFDLTFTKPVDREAAAKPETYGFQHYTYEYSQKYGSPQVDIQTVAPTSVAVEPDGLTVSIQLPSIQEGRVYQLDLQGLKAEDGAAPSHESVCYTVRHLRKPE